MRLKCLMYHAVLRSAYAGEIPKELGALSKLTKLYLHDNQLTGEESVERGDVVVARYIRDLSRRSQEKCPASCEGGQKLVA